MKNNRVTKKLSYLLTALLGAMISMSGTAFAQADGWPSKPVTIVVPFPAGGGTDAFARPLSAQLTKQLGKQIVIDNRGGAGGTLGASIAAKAAPDGYNFFVGAAHHAIAPAMYPNLDYDIEKSFVPVAMIALTAATVGVVTDISPSPQGLPLVRVAGGRGGPRPTSQSEWSQRGRPAHLPWPQRPQARCEPRCERDRE